MKSRLAAVFTLLALVGGSGGALAVGASSSHGGSQGAATAQYKPTKKKCPKGFHRVGKKCVKNGRNSKAGVRGQSNTRSRTKGTTRRGTGPSFTG